jgi:hypothetical protein
MKTDQMKPLSEIEWTTCWMAIRYAMGGRSAASASLPGELLAAYFNRWTAAQKRAIVRDLRQHLENIKLWNDTDEAYFGDKNFDHPIWMRFLLTLDRSAHVEVTLESGRKVEAFEYEGRFYPQCWWDGPGVKYIDSDAIMNIQKLQDNDEQ